VNPFKMVEDMVLKIITSRFTWMALPPSNIVKIYEAVQKLLVEHARTHAHTHTHTHTETGDLISLLSFFGSGLKIQQQIPLTTKWQMNQKISHPWSQHPNIASSVTNAKINFMYHLHNHNTGYVVPGHSRT
jgi:hypothetical protein